MLRGLLTQYTYLTIKETLTDRTKMKNLIADSLVGIGNDEELDPVMRTTLQLFLPALNSFITNLPEGDGGLGSSFGQVAIDQADVAHEETGDNPTSSYDILFPQGMIWGLIGCAAGFGISLVTERTKGTLVRLRTAPIGRGQILAGKALACFSTTVTLQVMLLLIGWLAFRVSPNSLALAGLTIFSASLCFVGIMMFLSVLGKTEQAAGGIGWAVLLILAMLGGGMVPLVVMPGWMQTLSHVSPVKWAIVAMEGAIWRDYSFFEMLFPCGILLGVGVVCFAIGVRAFSWTQEG